MNKIKTIYLILLFLLSITSFEIFSALDLEINHLTQLYGLVFCLQGSFGLIYICDFF